MYHLIHTCNAAQKNIEQVANRVVEENWNHDYGASSIDIKKALTSTPTLGFADFSQPFILETDACRDNELFSRRTKKMDDELMRMPV